MLHTMCTTEVKRWERALRTEIARECLTEEAVDHELELGFKKIESRF